MDYECIQQLMAEKHSLQSHRCIEASNINKLKINNFTEEIKSEI